VANRIVFVNRFAPPDTSATAQILGDAAEYLAQCGWDVTIVTSRALYSDTTVVLPVGERIGGVTIVRTATPRFARANIALRTLSYLSFYLTSFVALLRYCDRDTVLVVKTDPPLLVVVATFAAGLRGAIVVHWVQDLYPEIAAAFGMRVAAGRIGDVLAALRDASFRRAARVVAIGELMRDRIAARGIPRERIAVIGNWSDDVAIVARADHSPDLRTALAIPPEAFVLEYSGNLGRAHEYDTLLDAAERLKERDDVLFLFIGGGYALDQLKAAVAARGLQTFRFAPYQPRDQLSQSLGLGNAHWLSLRPEFEGLIVPSKVFGICAAGRAVVAVCDPTGEIPRILDDGGACLVVPPGDSEKLAETIVALAEDRARCVATGMRARAVLDDGHRRSHALAKWQALIIEVVCERDARRARQSA
jgi:glycosyltransferase involved in cell wall biosynthesis